MRRNRAAYVTALTVLILIATSGLSADPTVNPNHPIYDSITTWQVEGVVDRVPSFRP